MLAPGSRVGPYEIRSAFGRGGMGEAVVGIVGYMSPEQVRELAAHHRSDVFHWVPYSTRCCRVAQTGIADGVLPIGDIAELVKRTRRAA